MAQDWKVVIDDSGGPFSGWPSVCSEREDRSVLHRAGFIQEHWNGPSLHEAKQIAQLVADFMNRYQPNIPTPKEVTMSPNESALLKAARKMLAVLETDSKIGLTCAFSDLEIACNKVERGGESEVADKKHRKILAEELYHHGACSEDYANAFTTGASHGGANEKAALAAMERIAVDMFNRGSRSGWMRCGAYHIDIDFESRPREKAEIDRRWPEEK